MTAGIIVNAGKDTDFSYTLAVYEHLSRQGVKVLLSSPAAQALGLEPASEDAVYRDADFIAVLGGDGTMLNASHKAVYYNTPLLGINLGTLGYLTDAGRGGGFNALDHVLNGRCRYEKRMMLFVIGKDAEALGVSERLALNDIYISRANAAKLIGFHIYVNGSFMDDLRADGVIVSTPTGSTAYNLSAGGPILAPESEMIVITAVCPHALYIRPWVFPAKDRVEIQTSAPAVISLDGEPRLTLMSGEPLQITRSEYTASILKTSDKDFFEVLRNKMRSSQ